MQFTPGPWYVGAVMSDGSFAVEECNYAEETIVATVMPNFIDGKALQSGNAKLIAAAPEMLEALEAACRELLASDIVTQILREEKGLPHSECPTLRMVRDIIIKVTA